MSFLQVEKLEMWFGKQQVLKNVDLSVEQGKLVTLLGPSGCGKSTLLRLISGLETANGGNLYLDGKDISKQSAQNRDISMVFQSYALFPNMTVYDNISYGLRVQKLDKKTIHQKVMTMLSLIHLEEKSAAFPSDLSGGQQQRVSLARALIVEPKVLLLDEPLSALDAQIRKELQLELRTLQQELGMTMIFVTHDQEEAMLISDTIHVMHDGEIVQSGTPEELYSYPKNDFVASFIGHYNCFEKEKIAPILSDSRYLHTDVKKVAIRPEVIKLEPQNETDCIIRSCQYLRRDVLGNIVRCHYQINGVDIAVDLLNNVETIPKKNEFVDLYVNPKDFILL
ncbi:ABC transporter ATP-binding protein [Vagococcus entomophilus]|uniref:ABC-type quaternary amine transporter n=1 Tax=Vagococcus entomophilus TaxID=1160095 RepID=A0A430AFA7_9ENTE|nr:ABC transporter ATP-binding protein [Vagococcus entomophilus]RSU06406.1 hypothetical protein CBF30_09125 [Vagococcus entomophilus]